MIKILYIINNFRQGGAQKHVLEIIDGLDKTKFFPWLVVLDAEFVSYPVSIPTIDLKVKRIYDLNGIKGLLRLVRLIRKERFHIIHSYLFNENILGSIAGKIAGAPAIVTSRRDTGVFFGNKTRFFLLYRFTNILVDKIVCVSEAVKKAVLVKEKVDFRKIEVVYNGVDIEKFNPGPRTQGIWLKHRLGIGDDELAVGMISNANSSLIKGHKDFIEAARIVLGEVSNTKFLLIGTGHILQSLKSQVLIDKLQDKILFLGVRKDIPELLSIMDISVNASHSEGMSNAILQSMASGIPVVATAVDGNLETVVDGVTGILVPPGNPKAMAEAIIKILKDRGLARRMGENARKVVEGKFTNQIMLGNMEKLYKRLLTRKVAFIFSQFPCYDETFILREMNELRADGVNFVIYSIKPCKDKIIHKDAQELAKYASYLPLFSLKLIFINLFFALRHPLRYGITFLQVFFGNLKSANFFIKSIGLWMQASGFAWLARRDKVFHLHGQWATFPATEVFIISKLNNIPFSFTGHAHDIYLDTTMLAEKMKRARFITACTADNKEHLLRLSPRLAEEKIIVNYHGVDLEKFKKPESAPGALNDTFNILSVGSLLECKGFDILIDACRILKDRDVKFACVIAGGGALEAPLKQKVNESGLADEIKFTGYITQDKLIPLYHQADVFTLAMRSRIHWGIPNVLLEAMAAKVPVICTHLPSIPELINDEKTGLIIPEENPQALADALLRVYGDSQLREEIGRQSYEVIKEKFDIKKNANNFKDLFKLNVLYLIPSLELGGAERVVIDLASGLNRVRFNAAVCCLDEKGRFADELKKQGIRVVALHKKGKFDIGVIGRLMRVIKENRIDIVHTHLWGANFWGRIAAKLSGVKVIVATEHNTDVWKSGLYFMFDRLLSKWTNRIIAVSNSVKEFYVSKGINKNKIEVIYNGIDIKQGQSPAGTVPIKQQLGIEEDETVLAIIGRLVPQKGHKYFLLAFKELLAQHRIRGLIVGTGPYEDEIKQLSQSLGLNGSVIFAGLRKDVPRLLDGVDVVVMPSTREGLPIIALEAMAAGVPIVATKVGGMPEVVIDGQTGILVEPNNHSALKEALSKVIEDEQLAQRLGENAKRFAQEKFSLGEMLNKTQALYEDCLMRKLR